MPDEPLGAYDSVRRSDPVAVSILHVDMDGFYAAVEQRDDQALSRRPVVVGGAGSRGVVASCSYEARVFGIRSAMPSVEARRRCPAAVFISPRFDRYREVSQQLREILISYTPLVEPLGLDEAFLDVGGASRLLGSAEQIGRQIRCRVQSELLLGCSVGVGRTKLIAKLASRAAKPVVDRRGIRPGHGVVVVGVDQERSFLWPLPIQALWGVGPATARRLRELGITRVEDLATMPEEVARRRLGEANGQRLVDLARGIDPRTVVPDQSSKSLGHEETFEQDLLGHEMVGTQVRRMAESVAKHLRARALKARTVTLKLRFTDFSTITRSRTFGVGLDNGRAMSDAAVSLLVETELPAGIRLVGVSASNLCEGGAVEQLSLLGTYAAADEAAANGARRTDSEGLSGGEALSDRESLPHGDSVSHSDYLPHGDSVPLGEAQPTTEAQAGAKSVQELVGEVGSDKWRAVQDAIDAVQTRYGPDRVGRGDTSL